MGDRVEDLHLMGGEKGGELRPKGRKASRLDLRDLLPVIDVCDITSHRDLLVGGIGVDVLLAHGVDGLLHLGADAVSLPLSRLHDRIARPLEAKALFFCDGHWLPFPVPALLFGKEGFLVQVRPDVGKGLLLALIS